MEHPRKFEEEAEILEEAEESPNEVRTSVLSDPRTPTTDVSIRDRGKGRETWGVISASLGAMGPLIAKLDKLVQVYPQGCSCESVKDLLKDVTEMKTCMHNLSEVEDPPLPAKFWMNEARDLSYRMDDYIDSLLFVQPADPSLVSGKTQTTRSFRKWFSHVKTTPKSLEWHEQVAATLSEFKEYAQDAIHRHKVYVLPNSKIESTLSHRGAVSVGPMLPKPYEEAVDIAFDGRMNGFINSLANDGDKQLKVVSVLGPACLGKTTLVKVFYNKFGKLYDCRAFIRVSKNPDMKKLLHDILSQLRPQDPPEYHSEVVLIDDIKKYLQNKRYLLIVDNVWAASVWSIISHAFPKGNSGSRIITTTESEDVALTCCCYQSENVFEVKPLDDDHSRKLFFDILFGFEGNCPDEFKEDSNEIVELCGGLPLATVSIASLLASQPVMTAELLRYIHKSLGSCFSANSSSERTRQALNLSFSYLPQYLKTCLLYLSMYPEGYTFCKDDLVKQWIAECFISATEGQDMKKVAESYIDELIHRRFIQPIRINYYNEVLAFAVHDVVHDLIARKSAEEDFIVAIDYNQKNEAVSHKARRLSLIFGDARYDKIPENITKSQVRSLNFFGIYECMPTIAEYKLLRVLDLQVSGYERFTKVDLTGISELFQLRYLKIACNDHYIKLPTNGLQFLETLYIMNAKVYTFGWSLPLPQLLHLCLPLDQRLLGSLIVESTGRLNNLQDLHLTVSRWYSMEDNRQAIASLIDGHANLKSIVIIALESMVDLPTYTQFWFLNDFSPPPLLQRFEWLPDTCTTFLQIPKWVGKLDNLSILKIPVWEMLMDCVDILRGLRALTALSLYVGEETESIIFDKGGFSALKFLKLRFMSDIPLIRFEEDAMPNLWKLRLVFNATPEKNQYEGVLVTIDHMPSLKEISAKFGGAAADVEHGLTLVSNHESNPKLTTNNGLDASSSYYGDQSTKQKQQPDNILEEETDESTRQKERPDEIQEEVRDEYQKKQADDFSEEEPDEYDKKLDGRADKSISRSQEASSGLHIFTLEELFSATSAWCDLDLRGLSSIGFYRGQLVGDLPQGLAGQDIAIRCLKNGYHGRLTELEYLGTVRHPYLVKLLGICYLKNQTMLVYEYVDSNLKASLFRAGGLSFLRRLHVALEAAKGLAFLHDADKPIVHGNFNASNILLDHSNTVKLCGFGLLRNHPQKYTMENDVYNFGVVLLELLTGQPLFNEYGGGPRKDLVQDLVREYGRLYHLDEDTLSSLMDQSLEGNYSFSVARSTAKIAFWCLESKLEERARMRNVVDALEQPLKDAYRWYLAYLPSVRVRPSQ